MTAPGKTEAEIRHEVLTAWGKQAKPMVLAPLHQMAKFWLVQNDDYLAAFQGSYERMIATENSVDRLRGWRGTLVIVIPDRAVVSSKWVEAVSLVGSAHGISTWTERLP